ncbi:MAG: hypothetical protein M1840_005680 [Geoglossum simile]|nr:MAG: hypothetical protein M1840_005680 [Geoglossum simile]
MADQRSRSKAQSLLQPRQYGYDESSDHVSEKDATEIELEKLVFGDESGFREGIGSHKRHSPELIFGGDDSSKSESRGSEGEGAPGHDEGLEDLDDADLFFLDSGPSETVGGSLSIVKDPRDGAIQTIANAPVWEDSDDERMMVSLASNPRLRKLRLTESEDLVSGKEYTERLRRQYERLYPFPEWASHVKEPVKKKRKRGSEAIQSSEDEEMTSEDGTELDEEELSAQPLAKLLQDADGLTRNTAAGSAKLRPEVLDIQRTKDVGGSQPSAIASLSFHPRYPLLLSSGPASTLFLHEISPSSPSPNPLLTSVHLRSTPLTTTSFDCPSGDRIFLSGRRRYFHIWNLKSGAFEKVCRIYGHQEEQRSMERFKLSPCGRWMGLVGSSRKGGGVVNVLDAVTLQWVAQARIEGHGGVADFAWWADGEGMCIVSKGGEVGEWDIRRKGFVGRWNDEGAVGTTVIALGAKGGREGLGGDRWIAVGSSSGIVNIYDRKSWSPGEEGIPRNPKPTKIFQQLVTATSHLVFSPDGQLLAMSSRWKRDALRLIHLPSCAVYRNWPTSSTPLGRISSIAFSPRSNMLAVGNEQGKIRLWEIRS